MTAFTKKAQAAAQRRIGRSQARIARSKAGPGLIPTEKGKREGKLLLGKAAAKNLIEATIKLNRLKRENQSTDSNNEE